MAHLATATEMFRQLRHNRDCEAGEAAYNWLYANGYLVDCGCCGCQHPRLARHTMAATAWNDVSGDCRDDNNRF